MPSGRSPIYCAECGCEVDPTAWLCANCGKNLHEPDAMTSTRPYAPVTSKNSKPDFILGAEIFSILLIVVFYVLDIGLQMNLIPAKSPGHPLSSFSVVFLVVIFVILLDLVSDRP